jgi:hypothetical protein
MPDTATSVDQLTDQILDTIDTCRYRPDRAALRVQFMLHDFYLTQAIVYMRIVQPVLELLEEADEWAGNPVGSCERWEDYVPPAEVKPWAYKQAADKRFDAARLVREYLTALGGDQ